VNFFLADVRDGLGPYLAIYLLAVHHWEPASIGLVMTVAGLAALLAQTPAGALMDRITAKRAVVVAAAILVTASCVALPWITSFTVVAVTQAVGAVAGPFSRPPSRRYRWGSSAHVRSHGAWAATKRSITQATPWRPCWRAGWPIWAGRWWCST